MLSTALVDASLNLLNAAVELGSDPTKRTLLGWADVAEKLVSLLGQANNDLRAAPLQERLLVRRGMVITTLMARSVREVAPPEAQADTVPQAIVRGLSGFWDNFKSLGQRAIDGGGPASESSPSAALERALGVVARMAAAAAPDVLDTQVRPALLADWLGPPTGTLWYRALWNELTVHQELEQLAWLKSAEERRGVERQFMALWRLFCASPEGQALEAEVKAAIQSDGEHLWDHLARHYAGWGRRHVFGNLSEFNEAEGVVFMPLEDVYVEPWVRLEGESGASEPTKARSALRDAAIKHRLTVVSGAMGFGKTLTARMLVTSWAKEYREAQKSRSERWMPVYVSCRGGIKRKTEIKSLITETVRAYWRDISGEDRGKDDDRLSQLDGYRLIVVMDGFDEVVMSDALRADLLADLERYADDKCHFIVFTRPGIVVRKELPDDSPMFTVLPFEEAEQVEWLTHWFDLKQRGPRSAADVPEHLRDLLRTPVLLFMVASTWDEAGGAYQSSAALYERFLQRLARGKLRSEKTQRLSKCEDENPQIDKAADVVLSHLRDQWKTTHPDKKPTREDAMLWILGRIALEMHRRGQETGQRELTIEDAKALISKAIDRPADEAQLSQVTLACVLTTHLGLRDGEEVMFFGHRSFQEFLVARAWREQFRKITAIMADLDRSDRRGRLDKEEQLLEGLVIQWASTSTMDFLLGLLAMESAQDRKSLVEWAELMVTDSRIGSEEMPAKAGHGRRAPLALAAFAIGGSLSGANRFVVANRWPIRRLLSWMWLAYCKAPLILRGVSSEGGESWDLDGIVLWYGDFARCYLPRVSIEYSHLSVCNFSGAQLPGAKMSVTKILDCDLDGADLSGAYIVGSDLSGSSFVGATLENAEMHSVKGHGAVFSSAKMCYAKIAMGDLKTSNFVGAKLTGATLCYADLSRANFSGADLSGADLRAANLSNATLTDAILEGVRYTLHHPDQPDTLWPPGFDPKAAGAIENNRDGTWTDPSAKEPPPPTEDGDPT